MVDYILLLTKFSEGKYVKQGDVIGRIGMTKLPVQVTPLFV